VAEGGGLLNLFGALCPIPSRIEICFMSNAYGGCRPLASPLISTRIGAIGSRFGSRCASAPVTHLCPRDPAVTELTICSPSSADDEPHQQPGCCRHDGDR
jgi:hypothetical protein